MPEGCVPPVCYHEKAVWVCLSCGQCLMCCMCPDKEMRPAPSNSRAAQIVLHQKRGSRQTSK